VSPALEFGIFDTFPPEHREDLGAAFAIHVADARRYEAQGYTYYFFIEHQNARFPVVSAPAVYLTAVACATTALRIGVMVFQLPMHHTIRLAQDTATLDHLSNGRLEFGIGYGTQAHEFDGWCLDFRERRESGYEVMDVVLKAWRESEFSHDGTYWHFKNARPQPRPLQQPHPPVWMGGHSPASIAYAAEHNFHFAQNLDVEQKIAEKFERFRQAWAAHAHGGPRPRTLLVRHVHVAETDARARSEAEPYMLQGLAGQSGVARALSLREEEETPEMLEIARVYVASANSVADAVARSWGMVGMWWCTSKTS
jgi:alkanesulfonate monooxygenase SsuD/methylene tetrahydromethanopterin reductase-like flavin-dependent oxidoreductase (luciferase family)